MYSEMVIQTFDAFYASQPPLKNHNMDNGVTCHKSQQRYCPHLHLSHTFQGSVWLTSSIDVGFFIFQVWVTQSQSNHCLLANPEGGKAAVEELRMLGLQAPIDILQRGVSSSKSLDAAQSV